LRPARPATKALAAIPGGDGFHILEHEQNEMMRPDDVLG